MGELLLTVMMRRPDDVYAGKGIMAGVRIDSDYCRGGLFVMG